MLNHTFGVINQGEWSFEFVQNTYKLHPTCYSLVHSVAKTTFNAACLRENHLRLDYEDYTF